MGSTFLEFVVTFVGFVEWGVLHSANSIQRLSFKALKTRPVRQWNVCQPEILCDGEMNHQFT